MTREEAKEFGNMWLEVNEDCKGLDVDDRNTYEFFQIAIKALEQEPKTDTWSIKDVADTLAKHGLIAEQEPCEDCISRKEALKLFEDRFIELQKLKHLKDNKGLEDRQLGVNYCINILKDLPSVNPHQATCEEREKGECPYYAG